MKNKIKVLLVAAMSMLVMVGCSKSEVLEVSGSTSIAPLMEQLVKGYGKDVNVNADGSSAGIKAVQEEVSDIGMVSRELKDKEQEGLETSVIAKDAIAVVVNKNNSVKQLTKQQLQDIYTSKIKNWKDVGGKDLAIVLTTREDGSGTRSAFEEILDLLNEDKSSKIASPNLVVSNSTGSIIENVKQKEGAIGYVSLGSVDASLTTIALDNVIPNDQSIKENKYLLSRNFNLVSKNADKKTNEFLDFILSPDGQKIVKEQGFIPLT